MWLFVTLAGLLIAAYSLLAYGCIRGLVWYENRHVTEEEEEADPLIVPKRVIAHIYRHPVLHTCLLPLVFLFGLANGGD